MASGASRIVLPLRDELEPLRSPDYRRYLIGWTLYGASSWIFYTAVTWTFLASDGAAAAVGFLPLVLVLPVPVALIVSGVLTDRRGPRDIVVAGLLLTGLAMAAAAGLVLIGAFTFAPTLVVGFVVGIATGIVTVPAQMLMLRLVEQRHASGAAGSNLLTIAGARVLGGPVGGVIVALGGAVPAFLVAGAASLAAAAIFASLPKLSGFDERPKRTSALDVGRAFRWAARARGVLAVIGLAAAMALFVFPYMSMLSVVARDLVRGGAGDLGLLIGAGGIGVGIAAFAIHVLNRRISRGRLLILTMAISAAATAGLGISGSLWFSLILAAIVAAFTNMFVATEGLLVQTMTPAQIRGRVLALDGVVFNLANPFGTLMVGLLIDPIGARTVLLGMAGGALAAGVLIVAARPAIVRLGINENGELDDPRLAVRLVEPDASEGPVAAEVTPGGAVVPGGEP